MVLLRQHPINRNEMEISNFSGTFPEIQVDILNPKEQYLCYMSTQT
jgi:hypothetical protein